MKIRGKFSQALRWGLAFVATSFSVAHAGSFTVNPVRITLSATQAVAAITVKNDAADPTVIQLDTSSWTQHEGQDALVATSDVLATPPIITVPPGASRIIRVGLRRAPDPQHELTYRLFLREVPPPEPIAQALRVALSLSIPVFVVPAHVAGPQVQWHATRTHDGQIRLRARNTGQSHIQLGQLEIALADGGPPIATRKMADYLLPDNGREWTLSPSLAPGVGKVLNISSQADTGEVKARVTLEDEPRELTPTEPVTAAR
jgi:fimbrial chaperone protein